MFNFFKKKQSQIGIVGIDFQSAGICFVVIKPGADRKYQLCQYKWVACNDQAAEHRAVREFLSAYKPNDYGCVALIQHKQYKLLKANKPNLPADEIPAAMQWSIRDDVDFPVDDIVIDTFDFPKENRQQEEKLYVVAANLPPLKYKIDLLHSVNAKILAIDIPELAIRNILSLYKESDTGVAFLNLMYDESTIIIVRRSVLYLARTIPIGLGKLKRATLNATPGDTSMSQDLTQLADSLLLEIQRTLDYYESTFSHPTIRMLLLAPVITTLPNISAYIEEQLGLTTKTLDLNTFLESAQPLPLDQQAIYVMAVGAALRDTF